VHTPPKNASRTSLQGMIYNADLALAHALDPTSEGIPKQLAEKCAGIVIVSVVNIGVIFSGNVGSGVLMAKKDDGTWSKPSAVGLSGMGFGLMAGAEMRDVIVLIMDKSTVASLARNEKTKLSSLKFSLIAGPLGRAQQVPVNMAERPGCFSYTYAKGAFGGSSVEDATLSARPKENKFFYGNDATPHQILYEDGAVEVPATSGSAVSDLHTKLALLAGGEVAAPPTEEEKAKSEAKREEADKVAASLREHQDDVVEVNVEEEAKKEEASKSET